MRRWIGAGAGGADAEGREVVVLADRGAHRGAGLGAQDARLWLLPPALQARRRAVPSQREAPEAAPVGGRAALLRRGLPRQGGDA